jgi:hypothetical protein
MLLSTNFIDLFQLPLFFSLASSLLRLVIPRILYGDIMLYLVDMYYVPVLPSFIHLITSPLNLMYRAIKCLLLSISQTSL